MNYASPSFIAPQLVFACFQLENRFFRFPTKGAAGLGETVIQVFGDSSIIWSDTIEVCKLLHRVEWVQLMVIWVGCTLRVESFDKGPHRARGLIEWQSSLCEVVDHCLENFRCVCQRCTILRKEQLRDQLIDRLGCREGKTEIVVALSSALVRSFVWEENLTWGCSWTLLSFYGRRCSRGASQAGSPSITCLACNFSSNSIFLNSSLLVSASSPVPLFSSMQA